MRQSGLILPFQVQVECLHGFSVRTKGFTTLAQAKKFAEGVLNGFGNPYRNKRHGIIRIMTEDGEVLSEFPRSGE
jgi:hypothetical protein